MLLASDFSLDASLKQTFKDPWSILVFSYPGGFGCHVGWYKLLISRCAIKFYEDLGFMPQPVCHQDGDPPFISRPCERTIGGGSTIDDTSRENERMNPIDAKWIQMMKKLELSVDEQLWMVALYYFLCSSLKRHVIWLWLRKYRSKMTQHLVLSLYGDLF